MTTLTYEPIDTATGDQHRKHPLATSKRCECPCCGKVFVATRAICITGPLPFTDDGFDELQGRFNLYCDNCSAVFQWWAKCDDRCRLASRPLDTHIKITGNSYIQKFIGMFPQAVDREDVNAL